MIFIRQSKRIALVAAAVWLSGPLNAQAQDQTPPAKYRKFVVYAGVGPGYFFNNLVTFKDQVKPFQYAFSARIMWEPQHSNLSLGFQTGYYRLYSVSTTQPVEAQITNSTVPIMFVVAMKLPKGFYGQWAMGQSVTYNKVDAQGVQGNHDAKTWSLADFEATLGYRFVQKPRISYAVELKGFYSSGYDNKTLALLFVAGYRL
jgi:hypothetical protein